MAITVRSYIVGENGTLRFVSRRVGVGIHLGEDAIPEFAGTRQKALEVIIENENGKPVRIIDAKGVYWHFDNQGRIDQEDLQRHAFDLIFEASEPELNGNLIDIQAKLRRRKLADKLRWEVSGELLDRIAADIWGGKEVPGAIEAVRGTAPRRPPFTHEAKDVFGEIDSALELFQAKLDLLSEPALKGLGFKMREVEASGEWAKGLWEGLAGQTDLAREIKARHRTGKGTWHAVLTIWLKRTPTEHMEVDRKSVKCQGRKAAVEAGRKLLSENAGCFDANIDLQLEVLTDLEFDGD